MLTTSSHRHMAWLLFISIVSAYLLMAFKFPNAYIIATYEDLVGEWAQVFFFCITMLLAARQAITSVRFRPFFSLLALACLFVAGEEISWGQRLFALPTPEFFSEHNLQQETNLHNFFTGPISTLLKQGLEYGIAAGLLGYGLGYPWLLRLRNRLALWLEGNGLAAPPLYLSPFFILSGLLELGLFHFNEAEIAEILIPFALAIMTLNYLQASRLKLDIHDHHSWDIAHSTRLAGQTGLLFICVVCLAIATTLGGYFSDRLGSEMTDRYLNGVERFAGRYMRYEQWGIAADLYLQIQQAEPDRASLSRNLFRCYAQSGQPELAQLQLDQAIAIDLRWLAEEPYSISTNISLVRSYQLAGDKQKVQQHLEQALTIGLAKKTEQPQNPGPAYWLGRTYSLKGDYLAAYQEFQRAARLRPNSLKYRKALLNASRKLPETADDDQS